MTTTTNTSKRGKAHRGVHRWHGMKTGAPAPGAQRCTRCHTVRVPAVEGSGWRYQRPVDVRMGDVKNHGPACLPRGDDD